MRIASRFRRWASAGYLLRRGGYLLRVDRRPAVDGYLLMCGGYLLPTDRRPAVDGYR